MYWLEPDRCVFHASRVVIARNSWEIFAGRLMMLLLYQKQALLGTFLATLAILILSLVLSEGTITCIFAPLLFRQSLHTFHDF